MKKLLTLADHADAWHNENGRTMPDRNSPEWTIMYEEWVNYAFSDLTKER